MLIRILVLCAVTAYYFARSKPINKITQFVKFCCNNFWLVCSYAFAPLGDDDNDEMDEFLAEDDEEDSDVEEFNMEKTKIRLGSGLILRQKKTNTLISWCTIACESFLIMFILMYTYVWKYIGISCQIGNHYPWRYVRRFTFFEYTIFIPRITFCTAQASGDGSRYL